MRRELAERIYSDYDVFFDRKNSIDIGDGWYWLLNNTLKSVYNYQKLNKKDFIKITTIKEKFGFLNVYYTNGDDVVRGIFSMSYELSGNICEVCGTTEDIGRTNGWIKYVCRNCWGNFKIKCDWKPLINDRYSKIKKIKELLKVNL